MLNSSRGLDRFTLAFHKVRVVVRSRIRVVFLSKFRFGIRDRVRVGMSRAVVIARLFFLFKEKTFSQGLTDFILFKLHSFLITLIQKIRFSLVRDGYLLKKVYFNDTLLLFYFVDIASQVDLCEHLCVKRIKNWSLGHQASNQL